MPKKVKFLSKKTIIILLIAGTLCLGIRHLFGSKEKTDTTEKLNIQRVSYGNINVSISGDGVIEPFERYDITPLVNGTIEECSFNEADTVKKGDILYRFESSNAQNIIQKMENNIARSKINQERLRENIEKATIYAPHSGRLSEFKLKKGENIGIQTIAQVVDDSYYVIEVFYNKAQTQNMYVGKYADVVIPAVMSSVQGTISKISNISIPQSNGVSLCSVEITIKDKLSILEDTFAYAFIDGIQSVGDGRVKNFERYPVISEISGKVKEIYVSENDYVEKGQKILKIDEETYVRSLKDGEIDLKNEYLSLEEAKKNLKDYSIESPIDGVVLSKTYKAGDSLNVNSKASSLMVVANMSKVKFNMNIDELDIAKVKKGQEVKVTAGALEDEYFKGKVTSVAEEGISSNGVTNYVIEVTIDKPGDLKSGMNIDAVIVIENKENVLVVPNSAISKDGTSYYVNVYSKETEKTEKRKIEKGSGDGTNVEVLSGLSEGEFVLVNGASESISVNMSGMGRGTPGGRR
ncbi:MAG: efflux RND transporter periplasmic adaptor subunit [Clostridiales bacterium]|nr:efflux RND transporter periplasmic adaptor subunit [Clostridiales bacterium]